MNAQRISDGQIVIIKEIEVKSTEGPITSFLSSELLRNDPRNYAGPILDVLVDELNTTKNFFLFFPSFMGLITQIRVDS